MQSYWKNSELQALSLNTLKGDTLSNYGGISRFFRNVSDLMTDAQEQNDEFIINSIEIMQDIFEDARTPLTVILYNKKTNKKTEYAGKIVSLGFTPYLSYYYYTPASDDKPDDLEVKILVQVMFPFKVLKTFDPYAKQGDELHPYSLALLHRKTWLGLNPHDFFFLSIESDKFECGIYDWRKQEKKRPQ